MGFRAGPLVVCLVWGEIVGAKGAGKFFLASQGEKFFWCTVCVYTQNAQTFLENSKMGEKHKKKV